MSNRQLLLQLSARSGLQVQQEDSAFSSFTQAVSEWDNQAAAHAAGEGCCVHDWLGTWLVAMYHLGHCCITADKLLSWQQPQHGCMGTCSASWPPDVSPSNATGAELAMTVCDHAFLRR